MNNSCVGCFANESDYKSGCRALSRRIGSNCPFYKTKEKYDIDQLRCKEYLRLNRPHIYYFYYGKDDKYADRDAAE